MRRHSSTVKNSTKMNINTQHQGDRKKRLRYSDQNKSPIKLRNLIKTKREKKMAYLDHHQGSHEDLFGG